MISYMAELSLLMSHISCGKSISEHPAVFRASKHRTVSLISFYLLKFDPVIREKFLGFVSPYLLSPSFFFQFFFTDPGKDKANRTEDEVPNR